MAALKPILFWGATGQAKVLREFMARIGFELVAVFDNNPEVPPPFSDVPLLGGEAAWCPWKQAQTGRIFSLVAIGGDRGRDRVRLQRWLEGEGFPAAVAVHPAAFVAESAVLSKGCQILAQSCVCAEARLGEACIVNTGATVDHECVLGDGVHVAPGATLAGCVTVGEFSMISAGAIVLPRIAIGRNSIVGAGAVVTRDVPDQTVVWGNPARVRRNNPIGSQNWPTT